MMLDDAAFRLGLKIIHRRFFQAPHAVPLCTLLLMATSVLLESLRLLLLVKMVIFFVSDTSIAQDLNAQQACREAQDLCWTIIGALE